MEKMKKRGLIFIRYQWIIMTCILLVVTLFAKEMSFRFLEASSTNALFMLDRWLKQHICTILVCHILLLAAIYMRWSAKANQLAQQDLMLAKKIKPLRWVLIGTIAIIDFFVFH
jgi:hypothetical protein